MGVGIWLVGHYDSEESGEEFLGRITNWIDEDLGGDSVWGNLLTATELAEAEGGKPELLVNLYPANEPVEFIVEEPGRVVVSAKTSILGPGYHIALCEILKRLGEEQGITWQPSDEEDGSGDETDYFHTGNKAALEIAMLQHLRTLTAIVEENLRSSETFEISLSMPLGHSYEGGPIKTIVGVRDREWLTCTQADLQNGLDLFPWWEEGLTPRFYLGRAIVEMCMNVRWREHDLADEEFDRLDDVHRDLSLAYQGDPSLPFPWREWAEILDLLDYDDPDDELTKFVQARAAEEPEGSRLGYRRHPVGVTLTSGWSITIDGAMSEEWKDGTWSAWDGERTVWFSCWTASREDEPVPAEELLESFVERSQIGGERVDLESDGMIGRGGIQPHEEDGEQMWNLKAFSAVEGRIALCNLYYKDEADRDWAIEQWHSLKCAVETGE